MKKWSYNERKYMHVNFICQISLINAINLMKDNDKDKLSNIYICSEDSLDKDSFDNYLLIYYDKDLDKVFLNITDLSLDSTVYLYTNRFLKTDLEENDLLITRDGDELIVFKNEKNKLEVSLLKKVSLYKDWSPHLVYWNKYLDYGINKNFNIKEIYRNSKLIYSESD